jgi:hypothetical protein
MWPVPTAEKDVEGAKSRCGPTLYMVGHGLACALEPISKLIIGCKTIWGFQFQKAVLTEYNYAHSQVQPPSPNPPKRKHLGL